MCKVKGGGSMQGGHVWVEPRAGDGGGFVEGVFSVSVVCVLGGRAHAGCGVV